MTKKEKLINNINKCKEEDRSLFVDLDRGGLISQYVYFPNELNSLLYSLNPYDKGLRLIGTNQFIERWKTS